MNNTDPAVETSSKARMAVRLPRARDAAFEAELSGLETGGARRFTHRDDDELDALLRRGEFDVVLFPSCDELIEMILNGDAALDEWDRNGVKIRFVRHSSDDRGVQCDVDAHERALQMVHRLYAVYARTSATHRRNRVIACLLLSAVALAALATLFHFLPPAG